MSKKLNISNLEFGEPTFGKSKLPPTDLCQDCGDEFEKHCEETMEWRCGLCQARWRIANPCNKILGIRRKNEIRRLENSGLSAFEVDKIMSSDEFKRKFG